MERLLLIGNIHPNPEPDTASKSSMKITSTSLNLLPHRTQQQEHANVARSRSCCDICNLAVKRIQKNYPVYYLSLFHVSCLGLNSNHPLLGFTCNKYLHAASTLNEKVDVDNCDLTLSLVFEFDDLLLEGTCSSTLEHEGTSQNPLDDGALTGFGMDEKGLPVAAFNVQHYTNKIDAMQILLTQTPRPPDILFCLKLFLMKHFLMMN